MRVAALFSGGKDSTYAVYKARSEGHDVTCLVTVIPRSEESQLLHHPNIGLTRLQAKLMKTPQIELLAGSDEAESEEEDLRRALESAKREFGVEGVVHGGIRSEFQRKHFASACAHLGLTVLTPLWNVEDEVYLHDLINSGFTFIVTSVSAEGLDDSWLGKKITKQDVKRLGEISSKSGLNISFEGGEAETLVLACPIFHGSIRVLGSRKSWDGYRGRFEITEAALEEQC